MALIRIRPITKEMITSMDALKKSGSLPSSVTKPKVGDPIATPKNLVEP